MSDWGPEKFRRILQDEYLGYALPDGPEPVTPPDGHRDHVGIHKQKGRQVWVGTAPIAGRVSGSTLTAVADLAELRLVPCPADPHQWFPRPRRRGGGRARLAERLAVHDLIAQPSVYRRNVLACTGDRVLQAGPDRDQGPGPHGRRRARTTPARDGCPSASTSTVAPTHALAPRSATSASRAWCSDENDELQEVFQVHLGGALGINRRWRGKTRALKVTAEDRPITSTGLPATISEQRRG